MPVALIDVNERLASDFSEMNHKGVGPIVVPLGSQ